MAAETPCQIKSAPGEEPSGPAAKAGFAIAASYVMWGLLPVYWRSLSEIAPTIILAQRVVWSVLFTMAVLAFSHSLRSSIQLVASDARAAAMLALGGAVIALNWFLYIYAVNSGNILQTSLGYFINPLVSVAFGVVFFKERMRPPQKLAMLIAACGVAVEVAALGELPVLSLGIALTFGTYGVLKKKTRVDAASGLFFETSVLLIPSALWLFTCHFRGTPIFLGDAWGNLLLVGTGAVTSVPLILFAWGAKRLRLTTLGLIQYSSPTISFLLAVFVYGEPFTKTRLLSFGLIWTAIFIYTGDLLARSRRVAGTAGG